MADQPKKSVFDPPAKVVKGDGKSHDTDNGAAKASSPSSSADAPKPEHVKGFLDGLKGMLGMGGDQDFVEGGKGVGKAVDDAVASTPGNNADY